MSQQGKRRSKGDEPKATTDRLMLKRDDIFRMLQDNIDVLRSFGVLRLGLFGSFARDEATLESDIDFVVEFEVKSFDAYMELLFFLEDLFKRGIDLVTKDAIKPKLRPYIENEVIYAKGL